MSSPRLGSRPLISSRGAQTALTRLMRSSSCGSRVLQIEKGRVGCDEKATVCIVGSSDRLRWYQAHVSPVFRSLRMPRRDGRATRRSADNRVSAMQQFTTSPGNGVGLSRRRPRAVRPTGAPAGTGDASMSSLMSFLLGAVAPLSLVGWLLYD